MWLCESQSSREERNEARIRELAAANDAFDEREKQAKKKKVEARQVQVKEYSGGNLQRKKDDVKKMRSYQMTQNACLRDAIAGPCC